MVKESTLGFRMSNMQHLQEFVDQLGFIVVKEEQVKILVDEHQVRVLGQGRQGKAVLVVSDG